MAGKKVIVRTLDIGADPTLTRTFLEMGIDELSVSPTFVLPIRKNIREISIQGNE